MRKNYLASPLTASLLISLTLACNDDAVVVEPWGAHPSYVQGAYDRDNRFYIDWDPISRDEGAVQAWLADWVYGLDGRASYVQKLGAERVASLRPSGTAPSGSVDYGQYR